MRIKISPLSFYCFSLSSIFLLFFSHATVSDPQTNILNKGCSQYNVTTPSTFISNLNSTFADIHSQLNSTRLATAQRPQASDPIFVLFQCRRYLSFADCAACFDAARGEIRSCAAANGARVVYDGCFLRYESNEFYSQATMPGNFGRCTNQTVAPGEAAAFTAAVDGVLTDLCTAVPRMKGYFGATMREGGGAQVQAVAQCAETVTEVGCEQCLSVACGSIEACPPDSGGRAVDVGCFLRYSDTPFFVNDQVTDLAPFLRTVKFVGGSSNKKKAIIGGVAGGAGFVFILLSFAWLWRSKRTKKPQRGNILGVTELHGPVNYRYKDLKSATKNFSKENKLGEGGFGNVYKGVLKNGKLVAVKKLMIGKSSKAREDFESEVTLISNVHHRNLVRLLGCCSKGPELLLVYEFMANSSLDKFLFGNKRGNLNWKQRYDLIIGTARGLAYLHEEFHVRIIHRDIKSSNILLDEDFQPKIADFGLARLFPEDRSHLSTRFAGTLGYTAPEYAIHGQLSEKVDTYSYGVVVLEIISGRKSNDTKLDPDSQYLLEWAWKLYEADSLMKLVDESLDKNEYGEEEVKRVIEIALMCTQSVVAARPTMSEIVTLLLQKARHGFSPTRPTFIDAENRVLVQADTSTSTPSSASNATMSISQYSAR